MQTHTALLRREPDDDLGFSIAGGIGSTAFSPHDSGIFVSRVVEGGQAERQNLLVGDKVLSVSVKNLAGCSRQACEAKFFFKSGLNLSVLFQKSIMCSGVGPMTV